jgi:hypothetical protein
MQIVINHVTRMRGTRICIAGVDLSTGEHVRPVTHAGETLTRALLRGNGGPVGPGTLVDLGDPEPSPSVPEVEDQLVWLDDLTAAGALSPDEYLEMLELVRAGDLSEALGEDLEEVRQRKFGVEEGRGDRSLGVLRLTEPELEIDRYDTLHVRTHWPDTAAKLRVTDLRFYEADGTMRRDVVRDVNARLESGVKVYAMVGLAHAMDDELSGRRIHWAQVNGLCLVDRPVSDVP